MKRQGDGPPKEVGKNSEVLRSAFARGTYVGVLLYLSCSLMLKEPDQLTLAVLGMLFPVAFVIRALIARRLRRYRSQGVGAKNPKGSPLAEGDRDDGT